MGTKPRARDTTSDATGITGILVQHNSHTHLVLKLNELGRY